MPKVITDLKLITDDLGVSHLVMKSVDLRTFGSQMFENPITGEESDWQAVPVEVIEIPSEPIPGETEEPIVEPAAEEAAVEELAAEELSVEEPTIVVVSDLKIESTLEPMTDTSVDVSTETIDKPIKDTGW